MDIDGRTRVIPHLAFPSTHLKTPGLVNARCRELGLNAVVVPWAVAPEDLATVVCSLRAARSVPGMIVTIPHKESVANYCDDLEGVARDLNVVNIIRKTTDGRLVGRLYDGLGFVAGLRAAGIEPKGCDILLLGAGGAATALAQALAAAVPNRLVVANRSRSRAERLVERLCALYPGQAILIGEADATGFELVVNGTSAGLAGDRSLPLDPTTIEFGSIVAEVVMEPAMTPLLNAAQARGARVHLGSHMLTAQIDLFIEFLFGRTKPASASRQSALHCV